MSTPVAMLQVSANSIEGGPETTGPHVGLYAGGWRNYSTGIALTDPGQSLRIRLAAPAGVIEIGGVTVTRVSDKAVLLNLTSQVDLQSLECSGDMVPLAGGPNARFFSFGPRTHFQLPELNPGGAAEADVKWDLTVDLWMQWSSDLALVAEALNAIRTPNSKPLNEVASLRAELWAHQAERIALAAEYRRLKSGEQSLRATLASCEEGARAERQLRLQVELELARLQGETEHMRFNYGRLMAEGHERHALSAEIGRLRGQILEIEHARDSLRQECADLRASYSWKITGPLRAALRLVRGGRVG